MMWRKDSFLKIHYEDELWMDSFGFAYGDDALLSYKLHVNGGKLGVLYESGVKNLDAGSSSSGFKKSPDWIHIVAKANVMRWWRGVYHNGSDTNWTRLLSILAFCPKVLWQCVGIFLYSLLRLSPRFAHSYLTGLLGAISSVRSAAFRSLSPFACQ